MLTAKTGQKDKVFLVQLIGTVDDEANLETAIGAIPAPPVEVHVNCAQISRINSVGVKGWIKYFQKVKGKGHAIVFWDCAPPIVQQMNLVFNFTCGGVVASMQASFACESCEHNFLQTIQTNTLLKSNFAVPAQKCPKCGASAEFDDIPKMYFKFLMNK